MQFWTSLSSSMRYVFEGFGEIFAPDHDDYPAVGVQPFEDEPYLGSNWTE